MDLLRNPLHWQALDTTTHPGEYVVTAISLEQTNSCPHCNWIWLDPIGTRTRHLIDRSIDDKRVTIEMSVQRYQCDHCHKTFSQSVHGVADHSNITDRLVRHVEEESLLHTFKHVARLTTLSERQVRDTFNAQAERLLENYRPAGARVICMDGVYFGRVERALLLDGETGAVCDVFPHAKAWRLYRKILESMSPAQRAAVEVVVIDMSVSLMAVARRAFPNAVIVIDRFHVYNRVNKAMERIRAALSGQRGRKKGTRKMIRKEIPLQHEYQLEKEKNAAALAELKWWRNLLPEFDEAYQMKEMFCEIWYSSCVRTALARYEAWKEKLATCSELVRKHFQKELVGTVDNWQAEIFAYFEHRFDNGAVERRNGDVKALQREGKRLSFDAMRVKMIFGTALRRQRAEEAEQHRAERKSRRAERGKESNAATRKRKVGATGEGSSATRSPDTPESDQVDPLEVRAAGKYE